jgi:flagellar biosynthesis protein FliQ
MREADHTEAGRWLARHGLADAEPTPLLAARLAARRRAKVAGSLLLAAFLIGAALTQALGRLTDGAFSWLPLLVLAALVVGLLVGQWLLGWWVRRVDRRVGAQLSRRVAHPVELGWPAVLGRPYAVFTVATFTGAVLLAVSVLPVSDAGLRYGAIVVLIGLAGAGAGIIMQLRQVLASPAVAQDEASLTADVIMRVEDARGLVTPSLVWSLPAIFLYGESLGWWNAVSLALVVAGAIALCLIEVRATGVGTAARRAMAIR